jgi:lactate dehydrogenase-like 2-hydroxyacid dehydrogenase
VWLLFIPALVLEKKRQLIILMITPHIAWATYAARQRLLQVLVDNVASFLAGKPQNVVNGVE